MPACRLEPLRLTNQVAASIADLCHRVFSEPPYAGINRDGLEERLRRLSAYPQFDGRVALDEEGRLLGFAYGWLSQPGQWWHDQLRALLDPTDAERWLGNCFEFVELAVGAEFRGQGVGGALHDSLLGAQSQRTAILSVNPQARPAYNLYLSRGWRIVVEPAFFREGSPAVRIMGLDLPFRGRSAGREHGMG